MTILAVVFATAACGGGGGTGAAPPAPPQYDGFRLVELHPFDGELYVAVDSKMVATFSDRLLPNAVTPSNFLVSERATGRTVLGTVTMAQDRLSATFTPAANLLLNTGYRIRILPDVTSVSGESLPEEVRTVFTTALTNDEPPPPPPPPAKGTITTVGSMHVGRSSHTSTLMGDGKVLVAGGFSTSSTLTDTAEVYDPATEKFTTTVGTLSTARAYHTATKLTTGQVLLIGGVGGASFNEIGTAEYYDPTSQRFSPSVNFLNHPRAFHTATLLDDGNVLVTGGTVPTAQGSFSSKTAELYHTNPGGSTPYFEALPDMAVFRAGHTATKLEDGRVVLIGGNSTDLRVEIYDPISKYFILKQAKLHTARRGHTATLLPDGNILVMGGGERSAEIYVTKMDYFLWAPGYPLYDRTDHTATMTSDGYVLFTGGSHGVLGDPTNPLFFSLTTELYDPRTGAFLGAAPKLSQATTRHRATVLPDKSILITGGSNIDGSKPELTDAQVYRAD